jgi:MerR family transcriptional regulator, light-induced transcriptional regulator
MTTLAIPRLRDDYLAALLAGDGTRARHLVDEAVRDGHGIPELYLQVLQPALVEVGELWSAGELGVAYEHLAFSVTQAIVGTLGPRIRVAPTSGRLAVLVCTPGEQHALGIQMVADLLEAAEWEVLQLGASLPSESLVELVADECPDVVGLSTATGGLVPGAAETVGRLRALRPAPFVVVGGRAWHGAPPERATAMGADAAVADPVALVRLLAERLPALPDEAV